MVLDNDIVDEDGLDEFYEGYTVTYSALSSTDNTFTGNLGYSWVIDPPDIDLIGAETSEVSFILPEYIGQDRNYALTLTVDDGTLSSSVQADFTIEARLSLIHI